MPKVETSRVTVNMPVGLLSEVDKYAESMNINRTSAISVLLSQAIQAMQMQSNLESLMSSMNSLKNDNQ